jgi:lantibiotic modifying enzyme
MAGLPQGFRLPSWRDLEGLERPHLQVALEAWRWIETSTIATNAGVTWPADPTDRESVGLSLYSHAPGVLPFALELFHTTKDERFLDAAGRATAHLSASAEQADGAGLYTGMAGLAFVFQEMYKASGRDVHRDMVERATNAIVGRAVEIGVGVAWLGDAGNGETLESNDIVSGTAGIVLALLYLHDALGHQEALDAATRAGHRLLQQAVPKEIGLTWEMWKGYGREMPNFSHGTAGVSYALATLYNKTGDHSFLDAAVQGARYLQSIATIEDDGYLIRHHTPGGEDLYYLSWCHGPIGTNRLFYQLHAATTDDEWMEWMHRGARGIMKTGVPEQRTPGFWENVSQCGGSAGLGEFYLAFNRETGQPEYRSYVDRLTDDLLRRSTAGDDGTKWIQSEHRVQPDLLVAQTGFMQGAAGVGKFFLHLDSMNTSGAGPAIILPDSPY